MDNMTSKLRDSRTGYLVPVRDAPGALPDLESCWVAAAVVVAVSCHLEIQVDILAGELYLEFSYSFGVLVRDIWTSRPGFYTEFRYESREHSGLAWGTILRKVLVLTLIQSLPCSFVQKPIPIWVLSHMFLSEGSM